MIFCVWGNMELYFLEYNTKNCVFENVITGTFCLLNDSHVFCSCFISRGRGKSFGYVIELSFIDTLNSKFGTQIARNVVSCTPKPMQCLLKGALNLIFHLVLVTILKVFSLSFQMHWSWIFCFLIENTQKKSMFTKF